MGLFSKEARVIPILYPSTETAFKSNGLGRLRDCISCHVEEERNGKYECTFIYPITGKMYSQIEIGCYIACTHDDKGDVQAFQIYRKSAPINGQVTFNAHHISYQLSNVIVRPFTAASISEALEGIVSNAVTSCGFTFVTDKTTFAPFNLEVPRSARAILGGTEGSILDVFGGGEYTFDMFEVKLQQHRGRNRGVTIRYGKNLKDITQVNDGEELHNAVVPFWYGIPAQQEEVIPEGEGDEDEEVVVPEVTTEEQPENVLVMCDPPVVAAEGVTDPVPVILDLSGEFQDQPTPAELRTAAESYLATQSPWIPTENIKVDFIALWQTSQYENVKNLQRLSLCDSVSVIYPALGVQVDDIKIIKVDYDVLLERYNTMELGEPQQSYAGVITAELNKAVSSQIKQSETSMRGFFDTAIETATDLITGGAGGHVVISRDANGKPQEILIMDTEDINTATNILRINLYGIGFSTNGGQTYSTAWTIDGRFVADFITAGTLKAITIQGPTPLTFWNLGTGIFQNYGETTVTAQVETAEGTYTPVTYQMKHKTRIGGGQLKLDGTYTNGDDENLLELGLAAEGMNYDFLQNVPSTHSTSYPYAAMNLRGSRMTGEAGFGTAEELREAVKYNARGRYAPDFIVLGEAEKITAEDGTAAHPGYMPDRNLLRMTGGWVMPWDAFVFEQYYRSGQDGSVSYLYDPAIYRPALCYTLQDDIAFTEFYVTGNLSNSRTELRFSIPLQRPIGDPKVKGCVISADLISVWQYNSKLQTRVDLSTADVKWMYNNDPFDHQSQYDAAALQVTLKKNSGNWGGTNDRPVLIWFDQLWAYFVDYDNHLGE